MNRAAVTLLAAFILASCSSPSRTASAPPSDIPASLSSTARLPTGARLDPAGRSSPLGNMPLAAILSPDGRDIVVSLSGFREQGLQIVGRETGAIVQRIPLSGAFIGLAFSGDGTTLYASGGVTDRVYIFRWGASPTAPATLIDSIAMDDAPADTTVPPGSRYVSGLALSRDGRMLYAAENLADSIAVIDVATRRIVQELGTGPYPYAVATNTKGGSNGSRHNPRDHPDPGPHRRFAVVGLQSQLGTVPQRHHRSDPDCRDHPAADGAFVDPDRQARPSAPAVRVP
jgi:YVTN family beta-propeller protein